MAERSSERGVIVIVVAVMLLALMVVVGMVIDHGILMTSRAQAQNAADAAALAGAIARARVDTTNPPASKTSGKIWERTVASAAQNAVWGVSPPSSSVTLDWACPSGGTKCVVVDVFRDGTHGSETLPTTFLNMVGLGEQHIRAHAVAEPVGANQTDCLRPWFLIDKYTDVNNNGKYDAGDIYGPADADPGPATGWTSAHIGTEITFHANLSPSGYGQLRLDGNGTSDLREAIKYCGQNPYTIGDEIDAKPGNSGGQKDGIDALLEWDPNAKWDPTTQTVIDSCAPSCNCDGQACANGGKLSPRVAIAAVCSPLESECAAGGQNNDVITVTNFVAYFIKGYVEDNRTGKFEISAVFMGVPGNLTNGPSAPTNGAFLTKIRLIR